MFIAKKYSTFNESIFFSEYSVLLSEPWTPAVRDFGFALVMCVANIIFCAPPPHENPGTAPVRLLIEIIMFGNSVDFNK